MIEQPVPAGPNDDRVAPEGDAAAGPAYAFKCRNCGVLETADIAGDNRAVPAACRVCGAGVTRDQTTFAWEPDESNWIVLADVSADEEAQLTDYHGTFTIARHERRTEEAPSANPQSVEATANDGVGSEDRA